MTIGDLAAAYLGLRFNKTKLARLYRSDGRGGFEDVAVERNLRRPNAPMGANFGDVDSDGDQDISGQMGGAFAGDRFKDSLYENPGFGNRWITVELVGVQTNRSAIGARIRVEVVEDGKRRSIYKHVNSGGSFGANPLRQTIGLGQAENIHLLEVYWPTSDQTQTFRDASLDRHIRIVESQEGYTIRSVNKLKLGSE